jgi:hypothetical protein
MRNCDGPLIQSPEKGRSFDAVISFLTIPKMVDDLVPPGGEVPPVYQRKEF